VDSFSEKGPVLLSNEEKRPYHAENFTFLSWRAKNWGASVPLGRKSKSFQLTENLLPDLIVSVKTKGLQEKVFS